VMMIIVMITTVVVVGRIMVVVVVVPLSVIPNEDNQLMYSRCVGAGVPPTKSMRDHAKGLP